MFAELQSAKIILEVPRFRDQLPKTNQHGMNLNKLTQHLGAIYRNTVTNLYDKTGFDAKKNALDDFGLQKAVKPVGQDRKMSVSPVPSSNKIYQRRKNSLDMRLTETTTAVSPYMSRKETSMLVESQQHFATQEKVTGAGGRHAMTNYPSQQQLHGTSFKLFLNKTKNTESEIITQLGKKEIAKQSPAGRASLLNSITDDSEYKLDVKAVAKGN